MEAIAEGRNPIGCTPMLIRALDIGTAERRCFPKRRRITFIERSRFKNAVDVAEEEISISIGQLKRVPLEWGEEVPFDSYQGKERIGSFSVELLSVVGTLESSHWDRLLVRYAWESGRKQRRYGVQDYPCGSADHPLFVLQPNRF
jgi:hypothetical protein